MGGKRLTTHERAEIVRLRELGYTQRVIAEMVGRSVSIVFKVGKGVKRQDYQTQGAPVQVEPERPPETEPETHRWIYAIPVTLLHVRDLVNYCEALQAENSQWLTEVEALETAIRDMKASIIESNERWLSLVEASNAGIISHEAVRREGRKLAADVEGRN